MARILADAERVFTSRLTVVECRRVIARGEILGTLSPARGGLARADLESAVAHWVILEIDGEIGEHASRPFPAEPVRTLDAIHLASALVARAAVADLEIVSLDERIRANAQALGLLLAAV